MDLNGMNFRGFYSLTGCFLAYEMNSPIYLKHWNFIIFHEARWACFIKK